VRRLLSQAEHSLPADFINEKYFFSHFHEPVLPATRLSFVPGEAACGLSIQEEEFSGNV